MDKINPDACLDITDAVCPMTFVKVKVEIEGLQDGQILKIKMNGGEPVRNVPASLKEEGHKVIRVIRNEDDTYTVFVEKGGLG